MKIRIYCTSIKELQINNEKINLETYNKLNKKPEDLFEYILKVHILHKKKPSINFTTKTLVFTCNTNITEEEFINFIKMLQIIGFKSLNKKPIIQYINDEEIIIFNYNFNKIKPEKLEEPKEQSKPKPLYKQQNLYIKC
jgi:hypothetical protein